MKVLELKKLRKQYQNHLAVDNVSFTVNEGKIFGLLGPNGAGKTSTIRMITSITQADSGEILFNGEPLNEEHPTQIGYMPEERGLYKKMTVKDQIIYLARLKGLSKKKSKEEMDYWLKKFNIQDWKYKKVEELSKGMQQKIQFITTVIHRPKLLILDEPFSGLDPVNTNLIRDEIYELNKQGTSIIFSTHRMEQVEQICEEIVLINQGRSVLTGAVTDIKEQYKENHFKVRYKGELDPQILEDFNLINLDEGELIVGLQVEQKANELLEVFLQEEIQVIGFEEILPSLNEIFIKIVGTQSDE